VISPVASPLGTAGLLPAPRKYFACAAFRLFHSMQNPVLPAVIALLLLDAAMCAGFETGEDAKTKQIAEAIIQAYSLEADYWRNPERYDSWQKLYDHYRLGFSAEIAEQLTEFTRTQDGDMATWTPRANASKNI
jgi:hypothetical protein